MRRSRGNRLLLPVLGEPIYSIKPTEFGWPPRGIHLLDVENKKSDFSFMTAEKTFGPIRGVIKHRNSEKYYMGFGHWTSEPEDAMEFRSLTDVMEESHKYGIKDCCEFILTMEDKPEFRVYLPL